MDRDQQKITLAPAPGERSGPKLTGVLGPQVALPPAPDSGPQRSAVLMTPTGQLDEEQFHPGPTGDWRFPFLVYALDRLGLVIDQEAIIDCQPVANSRPSQWPKKLRQQLLASNRREICPEEGGDYWIFNQQGQLALARVEGAGFPRIYLDFYWPFNENNGQALTLNKRICWARAANQ